MSKTEQDALKKEIYEAEYKALKDMVESVLSSYLPEIDDRSAVLGDAMRYSLNSGGKRLRPVLLLAAAKLAGGSCIGKSAVPCGFEPASRMGGNANIVEKALPYACAVEYIHTYSLIHDDHPSMDNDDLRRGRATNHKVYGDGMALLAGDGLLNSAFDVMFEAAQATADDTDLPLFMRAAAEISKAAGVRGMIAGQASDFYMTDSARSSRSNSPAACNDAAATDNSCADKKYDDANMLRYIHKNKTGALICASVRAGAIIGGASDELLELMTEYAENLGLIFQIVDDILDVIGDEKTMGKIKGVDEKLGKLTYPGLYGVERSQELAEEMTGKAISAMENLLFILNESKMNDAPDMHIDDENYAPTLFFTELALDLQKRIT